MRRDTHKTEFIYLRITLGKYLMYFNT